MLELRGVTKRFGRVTAVDGLSIDVPDGQMVGVIGRSGAGKSTLLRMINRLHEPSAGSVTFRGVDVTGIKGAALHDWRARCAMIFQQFNLVDRLDVLTNVLIGRLGHRPTLPTLFKLFSADERAAALLALDRLDMAPQALQRADTLSGGQQQRVAIARALIQQPDIVLADEPIASLDPRNAMRVMEGLRTIHEESGITVICNLHQVEAAKNFCDRIVGMANGRLVFDGTPADLSMDAVREIYGATASDGEFEDAVGTTDLPPIGRRIPAEAAALA